MQKDYLSNRLEKWIKGKQPKTVQSLLDNFSEESFAVLIMVLMVFPAIPVPTAGFTHLFELIAMLLGLEMLVGLKEVWLPKKWTNKQLSAQSIEKIFPWLIKQLRIIEKYVKPEGNKLVQNPLATRIIGVFVVIFAVFAFIAPPFSNLDTLPAIGVVLLGIAMIFDNFLLLIIGLLSGSAGVALVILIGKIIFSF